jgi:hexosaminidase
MQRYNTIILHFSEAEGLRLDSEVFPWLTDNIKSMSREDAEEIVRFARRYHMEVIPSIDVPGHNRFMVSRYAQYVSKHPDFSFTYGGRTYDRSIKGFNSIANHYSRDGVTRKVTDIGIDITRAHAVAFADALIDDYAKFFYSLGCRQFDICGDEVMGWSNFMLGDNEVSYEDRWLFLEHWSRYARKSLGIRKGSASDTFISYLNSVTGRLEKMGYTCRVFNDEIDINSDQHVELRKSVGITCWDLKDNGAEHYAKKGHIVYNGVMQWSYYVVRKQNGRDIMKHRYKSVNPRNIYENWDPRSFSATANKVRRIDDALLGGACFFIWCDDP